MLEEGPGLGVCRDEWRALIGIFGGDIAGDGTALINNETIILDIERRCQAFVKRYVIRQGRGSGQMVASSGTLQICVQPSRSRSRQT